MGKKKELSKIDASAAGVAVGGLAQLSRNKKINNLGETLIIFALIAYIGEGIKWLLKWIIWKPCVFIANGLWKVFWWVCKAIYYYSIKYAYKGILRLIQYIKVRKTV